MNTDLEMGTSRSSGGQTAPSRCVGPGQKTVFDRYYHQFRAIRIAWYPLTLSAISVVTPVATWE